MKAKNYRFNYFEALNFDFWKNFNFEMSKVPKNSKFRAAQIGKMAEFSRGFKMTKIDFT